MDAVVVNWRGVIGIKNLGAAQIAFWDDALSKLVKTEEWDRDLERNLWENTYTNSAGASRYLKVQYEDLKRVMLELGFAK